MGKLKLNPTAVVFAVNALANLAVAWGFNLTASQQGAFTGIATAVCVIIAASATRPVGLQAIIGGATAIVTGLAPFGLHWSATQVQDSGVVLSLLLGAFFHLAHTPVAAFKAGTTAEALERRKVLG